MASVVFTEPAEYDLLDIEYYIYVDLCNHQAAERISNGILDAAEKLGEYPIGHPLVNDELLKSVGLRMTHFDNYNIFYYYDGHPIRSDPFPTDSSRHAEQLSLSG